MGYFQETTTTHDERATKLLKDYSRLYMKQTAFINHRNFLLRWRQRDILPKHLLKTYIGPNVHSYNLIERTTYLNKRISKTLLNIEIRDIHDRLNRINKSLAAVEHKIKEFFPQHEYSVFFETQFAKYETQFLNIKQYQIKKIWKTS